MPTFDRPPTLTLPFLPFLIFLSLTLTALPTLAAPTTAPSAPNNTTAILNTTLSLPSPSDEASQQQHQQQACANPGDDCEDAIDCCFYPITSCCMTSLEDQGDPFANYEGFCCFV